MILILNDGSWTIVTSSWSIGGDSTMEETPLIYVWGNEGRGEESKLWKVVIKKSVKEVMECIQSFAAEGICDLRGLQGG